MLERTEIIPDSIQKQLRAWADVFDENYDEEDGWPNLQICHNQYVEGLRIYAELRQHLGAQATVSYEFWETNVQGQERSLEEIAGSKAI
ncbi:hypothetical protein G7068_06345 [Leucobacter viscericola]|uniref:Uncharacterized protein n=1 Tax=Leucobacter viscericola TaxID=2714935 RepID=A0A6G7XER6_9MICO|nr:hypothetical protein [Leucobacter viscericola]QIK62861.1 hypothetical protein G7068_06345 [Leucobacter viscericola]